MRLFLLQIVDANPPHAVARIPYGGAIEKDLVKVLTDAIVAKRVGFFRTEAHVKAAIESGITDAIAAMKNETRWVVR